MAYQPLNNTNAPGIGTDVGANVRPLPQKVFRTTFSSVLASTFDSSYWTQIGATGTGQAISQSAGNGVITSGTTANQETILRSISSFTGSFLLRAQTILSQRITNNNFFIELVDVIGDSLAITVNSATSVTVTIPSNPFTSANVGQFMYIGALAGFTGVTSIPGRYAIASVSGNNVTFTVASWVTGSGNTGTCSLFGWNYHQLLYDSTTATQMKYDCQRKGWNSGFTTATINTTASPGHMAIMGSEDGDAFLSDQLIASGTTNPITRRASRVVNMAEEGATLYLQIRCVNGTSAPASTTTWTIGAVSVENYASQQVTVANNKAQSANATTPVTVENTPAVTVSSGTVTTVSTLSNTTQLTPGTAAANLGKAEDAPSASGDTGVFVLGVRRDAPVVSASANGDYQEPAINKWGGQLVSPLETTAKTYSASSGSLIAAASATDLFTITGNATTTVYVTKITIAAKQATGTTQLISLVKRSTTNTGGTSTSPTAVPHDAADAAASATLLQYTANPSALGTLIGSIRTEQLFFGSATVMPERVVWDFGNNGKPIVLSGTSQVLAVNGGASLAGAEALTIWVEWYEI